MANFLAWGVNNETKEFGAFIQLNPRAHVMQPDGSFVARQLEPKTQHFNETEINRRVEVASPASKNFWEATAKELPRALAMYENKADMSTPVAAKAAPALDLALTAKPVMSV
jgi:hypothetical protein